MQWGKANEEFSYVMIGIFVLCALGFLSSIFPIVATLLTVVILTIVGALAVSVIVYVARMLYRDHQALHGPISPEEKK